MTAKPCKPLLVNLTWAGVLSVALLAGYVASLGGVCWLLGAGRISAETYTLLTDTVYAPAVLLTESHAPGSRTLSVFCLWCLHRGLGDPISWSEADELIGLSFTESGDPQ
jgi:hypothetical protein